MNAIGKRIRNLQRTLLDGVVRFHPNLGLDRRAEGFVKLFENEIPKESFILDVGGGWGFYSRPLKDRGHKVTVLDVVKPGLQKAPVVIYDGSRIPFPDNSFDVSLMITVLHHIPQPERVIAEVKRVTRNRVVLVEDVYHHDVGRLWTKWRDQLYNFEFFGHPGNFKKRAEWIQVFQGFGFKLIHENELYTWLSGLRILNALMVFEKGKTP